MPRAEGALDPGEIRVGPIGPSGHPSYELVTVDNTMRTMIHDGAGEHELEKYARTLGPSIREDGVRKILEGNTSVEEVVRVTRSD